MYKIDSGYLSTGHCIYVNKDVRIFGYFSKPKGAREQKKFGKHCSVFIVTNNLHAIRRKRRGVLIIQSHVGTCSVIHVDSRWLQNVAHLGICAGIVFVAIKSDSRARTHKHTRTHTHAHTHTRARTHAHTHTRARTRTRAHIHGFIRNFRLPPWRKWVLSLLLNVTQRGLAFTDLSGQIIGPTYRG
jgi:hypothetical protein